MNDYWEIIDDIADSVLDDLAENPDSDELESIYDNMDRFLIYYSDQGIILKAMLIKGIVNWGQEVNWDSIFEELIDDVINEIETAKEQRKEKNERV